jgi:glucose dehydrogenase
VWNGLVYIGTAGANWGQKARMMALRTTDGHRVWNFDLIPTGNEPGAQTWGKASTASTGGGSTWTSYSLDPKTGLIYVPVGNPAPDFSGDYRPGANLYTDSLVVLDAKTGSLKWYYQLIPHDVHDYDLAAPPALVDTPGGKALAIIAGKDCTLRALDRATGKLVYQSAVCQRSNTTEPPTPNGTRVCPGWIGGVEWNGPAYDGPQNTVFVNSVDWCGSYHLAQARYVAGTFFLGGAFVQDPPSAGRGSLTALDADTGAIKWKYYSKSPMVAAVTPTAGGLVFTGEIGGRFLALDSQTGSVRYSYDTKGAIAGGIVTYMQNDKQYVAVEAGNESRLLWITVKQHPTLYLFSN